MDVSDWASVATIIVATITTIGVLIKRIDKVETKLDAKIDMVDAKLDKTREESRADIAELRHEFRFLSRTIVDFLAHPPQRTAPSPRE